MELDNRAIENELDTYGVYASNTKGVSMEPLFRTNRDMVIIRKPSEELKKYDVALYRSGRGKYVLHRVIGVKENEYLIRGDNTYIIEHVPKDNVIGVLTEFNRKGKHHLCTEGGYIFYSAFWNFIYPIRFLYRKVRSLLGRIYRFVFKRNKKTETDQ